MTLNDADDALLDRGGPAADWIGKLRKRRADDLTQELFTQKRRVADAERALQVKETKKAREDVRIGTDKMGKIQVALDDLRRKESKDRDFRIYPGMHTSVIVSKGGKRIIRPMRYQCRHAGKPDRTERHGHRQRLAEQAGRQVDRRHIVQHALAQRNILQVGDVGA